MFDKITNVEISHFRTFGSFSFTVPFTIPVAVAMLKCIGVGACRCPISCKVSLMVMASF